VPTTRLQGRGRARAALRQRTGGRRDSMANGGTAWLAGLPEDRVARHWEKGAAQFVGLAVGGGVWRARRYKGMPINLERCGSVLRLGERVWNEYRLVLSSISNSKFQHIQTAGIRGPQFQFRIPALNVYFQTQPYWNSNTPILFLSRKKTTSTRRRNIPAKIGAVHFTRYSVPSFHFTGYDTDSTAVVR
jgi:hypothetical protein